MTSEEVERSIEFLLQGQANLESQMARSNAQMEQAFKQIGILADTQNEFMQVVTRHIEAQGEINAGVRDSLRVLTSTVEKYFSGSNGGAS
jgi:hypothetical protein